MGGAIVRVAGALIAVLFLEAGTPATADGLDHWTQRASGVRGNLCGVAYGKGQYVCVGQVGTILVSSDGTSWESVRSGVTSDLSAVTFANGQFLAVGQRGLILKSTNAVDWLPPTSPTTNQLNNVGPCGEVFVATGNAGTLLTSPDGSAWTTQSSGTPMTLVGCAFGNCLFLAVGRGSSNPGTALTSSNAVDWVDRSYPQLGVGFYSVSFGNGMFVAFDVRGIACTSTDGISWSSRWTVTSDYVFGSTFAQGLFVGVGGPYSGGSQKVVTSPDGRTWRLRSVATGHSGSLRAVTYGNGYFVAVGDQGLILQSDPVFTLRLAGISGGVPVLLLDGERSRTYDVQTCDDLAHPNWTDLLRITNTAEVTAFPDAPAGDHPVRLYRAVSL